VGECDVYPQCSPCKDPVPSDWHPRSKLIHRLERVEQHLHGIMNEAKYLNEIIEGVRLELLRTERRDP